MRRCCYTKPKARMEQTAKSAATISTATESRLSRTSMATFTYKLVTF